MNVVNSVISISISIWICPNNSLITYNPFAFYQHVRLDFTPIVQANNFNPVIYFYCKIRSPNKPKRFVKTRIFLKGLFLLWRQWKLRFYW